MSPHHDDPTSPRRGAALVVMARVPEPGRCKTRLCPPLTPEQAADLYRAFLVDIAALLADWRDAPCDLWVAWAGPSGGESELRELFGDRFRFLEQQGETLTDRMEHVFETMLRAGYRSVVMRNSDSPHLPIDLLRQAFDALASGPRGTVVLGPDLDGGYYLAGLDVLAPGLLPRTMSTGSVYEETVAGAERAGLEVVSLPRFPDIDTPDDLRLFWIEYGSRADVRDRETWRYLAARRDLLDV